MDHERISTPDDASWKQRCWEKMQKLGRKYFIPNEDEYSHGEDEYLHALRLRQFQKQYATQNELMNFNIYKAIEDGDPDKFFDVLEDVCKRDKLPLSEIFQQESHGSTT